MTGESPAGLPLGFHEWAPVAQATALALATFVQEDAPTITAALLAAAGRLHWLTGLLGCFLGIWIGDALLYLTARIFGRPLIQRPWVRRWANPEAVARSERWFAEQGTWLLLTSRFLPGTRLPTYLAAGFLGLPFGRFLMVTGVAVAGWTVGIFSLAHWLGPRLQAVLAGGLGWWVAAAALVLLLWSFRRVMKRDQASGAHSGKEVPASVGPAAASAARWTHWEFWPAWLFYLPVGLNYGWLALRHRGWTVPSAANPGITTGGLVGESKFATLAELWRTSPEFTAQAWLLPPGDSTARWESFQRLGAGQRLEFPLILKPDIGQRGVGVRRVRDAAEAAECLRQNPAPLVVQRYVPGPLEAGVFYYRFPHEEHGKIFALTEKVFPTVAGNGMATIEELILGDERARRIADRYLARFAARRHEVLAAGATLRLVEAGNHAQGCVFLDGTHRVTPELTARFDEISRRLPGFFIGRYDVRFAAWEDLQQGRNFQILELNGAASEATSIYDARNSLWTAYRTLFRQWALVFAIGAANRTRGVRPIALAELLKIWRETRSLIREYPLAD